MKKTENKPVKKVTKTDDQTAFEYILYMIADSYFDKTECTNSALERKMRSRYWGMKPETQYRAEALCDAYVREKLLSTLPEAFRKDRVQVRLIPYARCARYEIRFESWEYILRLRGEYKGRKSKISCQLWRLKGEHKAGPVLVRAA